MKNIGLDQVIKNNDATLPEKSPFPSFHFNVFFANISSKLFKRISKDTEFCSQFRDIFRILEKTLFRYIPYFLVFGSSQLDNEVDVHLLNFLATK